MEALLHRIQLREVFLDAVESPQHIKDVEAVRKPWKDAIPLLPRIKASHNLGKAVDEAFSVKLQRKLASTMPPRAIVQMEFEEAFSQLSRLFHDGLQLVDVLKYHDSQSLLVYAVRESSNRADVLTGLYRHSFERFKPKNHNRSSTTELCCRHFYLTQCKSWEP